jgi:hydroxymethylbilane synthase
MNRLLTIGCPDTQAGNIRARQVSSFVRAAGYHTEVRPLSGSALQAMLASGSVDVLAVPSDSLPAEMPDELELIAITRRENAHDVVLSVNKSQGLSNEPITVGVTSALRKAFVSHYYPSALPVLNPSLDQLINRLRSRELAAVITSHEEATLFDADELIAEQIETSYFVPQAGQGSTAIVSTRKLHYPKKEMLQQWVNHEETEDCIRAERAYLKALPPAENMLPFGYALYQGALITLKAGAISANGKDIFKSNRSAVLGESRSLGKKVAAEVLRLISEHSVHAF